MDVTRDTALDQYREIEKLDEVIQASSGNKDAGKRALANQIASETETEFKKMVDNLVGALNKIDDVRVLVGATTAIQKAVRENFSENTDKFLSDLVESQQTDAPKVSDEELASIIEKRRELVKIYGAMTQILEMLGQDVSDLPTPKKMSGPRGKQGPRGPRVPKNLQWSVDGKERSATTNTLSSMAATLFDPPIKTAEFREFLTNAGFDFENIPANFETTLPSGKTLTATLTDDPDEDDETEDEVSEVEE
jgi:hypothetical protein